MAGEAEQVEYVAAEEARLARWVGQRRARLHHRRRARQREAHRLAERVAQDYGHRLERGTATLADACAALRCCVTSAERLLSVRLALAVDWPAFRRRLLDLARAARAERKRGDGSGGGRLRGVRLPGIPRVRSP